MITTFDELRLLADIGGTNARFALQTGPGQFECIEVLSCAQHATIGDAMSAYLALAGQRGYAVQSVRHAAIAIANPVESDVVSMTNHHWSFSISGLRTERNLATLLVVNDFTALAMSLPYLQPSQRERIGGGEELHGRAIGLIGPGTGLGVGGVIPAGTGWVPLASEGGHATFAPNNREEARILDFLWNEFGHVSAERLLSGMGLELIHRARTGERLAAPDITGRALDGQGAESAACEATVKMFCAILGSVAGNVALTLGATGGMYIGGGIVPRLGKLFSESQFRQRFEDKGRLSSYLARIPTYLITEQYPALIGVAAMLSAKIAAEQ
ncbi:glucokinase [Massilia arenosa]|uniref:Glucokinase n=1 Tax=Zemynaea arenosa TaxID=2561931 RepID=A0A4Y9SGL3_9BURK|nr:glucokinase [Massilia arenosa]TFW20373.1 glucokinase [Massilia arenosa]